MDEHEVRNIVRKLVCEEKFHQCLNLLREIPPNERANFISLLRPDPNGSNLITGGAVSPSQDTFSEIAD